MIFKIPKSISTLKLRCLELLSEHPKGLTSNRLAQLFLERYPDNTYSAGYIAKTLSNLPNGNYATRSVTGKGNYSTYHLTEYGKFALEVRDQIPLKEVVEGATGTKRTKKPSKPIPQTAMDFPPSAPAPEPIRVNISETANNVADYIADLIEENRRYRELMITLHKTLTKELGLDAPTINGEPLI